MLSFKNNAQTTLADALLAADEVIGVSAMSALAPLDYGKTQLATLTHSSMGEEFEIVEILGEGMGSGSAEYLSVVRAKEETTAKDWPAGTVVSLRVTAGMLQRFMQADENGVIQSPKDSKQVFVFGTTFDDEDKLQASVPDNNQVDEAFIFGGRSRLKKTVQLSAYPVLQIVGARPDQNDSYHDTNFSYESVGGSFPVDLGEPAFWGDANTHRAGSVVQPTVPDGNQYWLELDDLGSLYTPPGGVEPTWIDDWRIPTPGGAWHKTQMPVVFTRRFLHRLVVTEVGFIAFSVDEDVTNPVISIGTRTEPTKIASAVSIGPFAEYIGIHRIPVAAGAVVSDINFRVDTPATGGALSGRFYWRGFFVEFP